jgi:cytochrome c-type biogenesis protein CcmH
VRRFALVGVVLALVLVPAALASEQHPTLSELQHEVMCPVCGTTLDQSSSPAAKQIERAISQMISAGYTKSRIKRRLVADYGQAILAEPPKHGFGLLAWVLPLAGIVGGAGVVGVLAWRWSRARAASEPASRWAPDGRPLEPELERRLDEELARFD